LFVEKQHPLTSVCFGWPPLNRTPIIENGLPMVSRPDNEADAQLKAFPFVIWTANRPTETCLLQIASLGASNGVSIIPRVQEVSADVFTMPPVLHRKDPHARFKHQTLS
jgi:hypothetical protein